MDYGMNMNMGEPPKSSIFSSFGFWLLIIGIIAAIVGAILYFADLVSNNLITLGLIGLGVLLLIIGIILLVVRSKKNKKMQEEYMQAQQRRQQEMYYQEQQEVLQQQDMAAQQGMPQQGIPQNYGQLGMPYAGY